MIRKYSESDREAFEAFVSGHKNGSFMQSSFWPLVKKEWQSVILLSVDENGAIKGTISVLVRKMPIPLFNVVVAYAPRGPVCDYTDLGTFKELTDAAALEAKKMGACVLKMDPDKPFDDEELVAAAKALGLKITVHGLAYENMQPICNHKIDLTAVGGSEGAMKYFNSRTRNHIRTAEKRGAAVAEGTEKDVPEFYEVIKETEERKSISLRDEGYYYRMLESIPAENLLFLVARVEDRMIAGAIFILYGKTVTYSYSAMANDCSHYNAMYLIQKDIISLGSDRGFEVYDMGGVDGNHPDEGVAVFKQNFGGRVIRNIGELDKPIKRFKYWLFNFSLGTGRKFLRLFKRKK